MKKTFPLLLLPLLAACGQTTTDELGLEPPQTVESFQVDRYLGTWFEIANYPQFFQEGCTGTTAEYGLRDDGEIDVTNRCTQNGDPITAEGRARPVELDAGKLEVGFFGPFFGDYWVVDLGEADGPDKDYTHALVTAPSRDSLWILSRTPDMDEMTLIGVLDKMEELAIDVDRLEYTDQSENIDDD
jgi:apolipoprotein D and lipocalin family protein